MIMYENRMIPDEFGRICTVNANPDGLSEGGVLAQSALNVLTLSGPMSWEAAYRLLLDEAHRLCLMPDDERCVRAMLQKQGFFLQPTLKEYPNADEICRYAEEHCFDGQQILLRLDTERGNYGRMAAVLPADHPSLAGQTPAPLRYRCTGSIRRLGEQARQIWVRWPDGVDHSPKARRKGRTGGKKCFSDDRNGGAYAFYQANPEGNAIGDCAVRAMASVCGIDWHEALDRLARTINYRATTVNTTMNLEKMLEAEGFLRCRTPRIGGRSMTGGEFCAEMDRRYHDGERIFAYVGSSHAVAVLPISEADGTHYRILDNWDSSNRHIFNYFVKFPPKQSQRVPEPEPVPAELEEKMLCVGLSLRHPSYGTGTVTERIGGGFLRVQFADAGMKLLSAAWVVQNCSGI